jgi:peptide/nickel transport system substrate-binding protein
MQVLFCRMTAIRKRAAMPALSHRLPALLLLCALAATPPAAADMHAIAMHGAPALPEDYAHLPYANPDAPDGGRIVFGAVGGFDSMNPYLPLGRAPYEIRAHTVESLLGRSWDEPFTLYGLLARGSRRRSTAPGSSSSCAPRRGSPTARR